MLLGALDDDREVLGIQDPLTGTDRLMSPALPWVYGQSENTNVPSWVKEEVQKIRNTQPKEWAPGTTPWPQAPKGAHAAKQ